MRKRVYISADYDPYDGDKEVVDELNKWGKDNLHKVDFVDMSKVVSGSVSNELDCRICDLKAEFNSQINASSAVVFIVGDKTATRTAGSACDRINREQSDCYCTPYKKNSGGQQRCKIKSIIKARFGEDVGNINSYSYLRHEFEQAKKKGKDIIILYNSTRKETSWLPSYMSGYEDVAYPFWTCNYKNEKIGNYAYIKSVLEFE